ncbi:hypothetical protein PFNF54_03912, partial [Plasmodium falciparum NF54]
WRDKLKKCIEDPEKKCKNGCNKKCECYERWVDKKKGEWKNIKDHFDKQPGFDQTFPPYYVLEDVLEESYFPIIQEAYGDSTAIQGIKKTLEKKKKEKGANISEEKTILDEFLNHELKDAETCKNCEPRKFKNPCSGDTSGDSNKQYEAVANTVAQILQGKAQKQLHGNGSRNALKGNIQNAKINNGRKPNPLTDACQITKNHSNGKGDSNNPCNNKGNRLKIGQVWSIKNDTSYTDVYMPPRRQHMCTSNLEKLNYASVIGSNNVNDKFLVEVLHAAKSEAEFIKKKYNEKQNDGKNGLRKDQATTCRAIRYSFADIGDIIRGKDLWDDNNDAKSLQTNLKAIFKKIKEKHPGIEGNDKYVKDNENKQLRSDWWEANRRQVWNAMTCETPNGDNIKCDVHDVPVDDYIPQRLRWMTEWAEWFCKAQSQEYDKLFMQCAKCMGNGQGCTKDSSDGECEKCKEACTSYANFINTWKPQWVPMQIQYALLYSYVGKSGTIGLGGYPDYKQVVHFFEELQKEYENATRSSSTTKVSSTASPITPYSSPEGYIHQELPITGCQKQKEFCYYKNGLTSRSSDAKENKNYAFKNPPHGYDLACTCNTRDQQTDGRGRVAVNPDDNIITPGRIDNGEDDEESDEEDFEEEELENDDAGGGSDVGEEEDVSNHQEDKGPQKEDTPQIDVCAIVKTALTTPGNLTQACKQKYGPKAPTGWKCVPSGDSTTTGEARARRVARSAEPRGSEPTSDKGSICVPPRRRKLYLGGFKRLTDGTAVSSETTSATSSHASNGDALLTAFVESASVETFFAWHKYKMEKKQPAQEGAGLGLSLLEQEVSPEDDPEKQLQTGTIPPDFLRLMFYTLGDYRDILDGKNMEVVNLLKDGSPSDKEMYTRENKINQAIDNHFSKNENQATTGVNQSSSGGVPSSSGHSSSSTVTPPGPPQTSGTTPKTWWQKNGEHIWNGMICALTYEDNGAKGTSNALQQNEEVKKALWDETTKKPKDEKYQYDQVKLDENSVTDGPRTTSPGTSGDTPPTLSQFISRPPYFRYLEEWGETFCRQRTRMLKNVKDNCTKDDKQKYSGDGEECEKVLVEEANTFKDLEGRSCADSCRSYKKWIGRKKDEYDEQESAYGQQQKEYVNGSKGAGRNNDDKEFCTKLEKTWTTAGDFLKSLGPCKNNDNGEGTIKFNGGQTFQHTNLCDSCSEFKIKCENGVCSGDTKVECNGKTPIAATEIAKMITSTEGVFMTVSDNSDHKFDDGLKDCQHAGIFKGIRKDVWTCGNVCGYVVCKPKEGNRETASGENKDQIITIRALVTHWVQNFLEDYKKIKHKFLNCTKNGQSKCINGCNNKCTCVETWISTKKGEWKNIKERFIEQYKGEPSDEYFNVRSCLETFIPQIPVADVKNEVIKLSQFDNSCGCSFSAHKQKDSNQDSIECMIKNLEKKIDECKTQHYPSGKPEEQCKEPPPEDDYEDENEKKVESPTICPKETVDQKTKVEDEKCDKTRPVVPKEDRQEEEESKKKKDETALPPPEPPADSPPPAAPTKPLPSDNTSDILKTTIPFGIALALTSIALLFLKKKTKSSVGNLFQILQIPKSDYDIPTPKSSNRYIPYVSDTYKGKTYIYMEGDSSGEEKYAFMSDTTDVTSSESEYEELDINEIYPYQSPKYKTLIEVVLEPSGKNTTASGNNTTASGNNTTASGNNTTASDTQNDIQNDGIPSDTPNTPSDIPKTPSDTPPPITDDEWNQLKHDFISNMLQNTQNTEPNMLGYNVDNNTHPTPSRHTLDQKPFITSIHDRNLYTGEEYNYNVNMSTNSMDDTKYVSNNVYSGIDLINDSLNSGNQPIDIYDELLKRKENELFGTNHPKHTNTHNVTKSSNSDPIDNQLDLFHTWLDRHRDMCEKLKNDNERLAKLKE